MPVQLVLVNAATSSLAFTVPLLRYKSVVELENSQPLTSVCYISQQM